MIVATLVFIPLSIVGITYTLFKHVMCLDYRPAKQLAPIFRAYALSLDGLANSCAGELLTDVYKPKYMRYARWDKTISAVTGINYLKGYDTRLRKFLDRVLGRKHCQDAVTKEDLHYYF